jgi:hypothetical protein
MSAIGDFHHSRGAILTRTEHCQNSWMPSMNRREVITSGAAIAGTAMLARRSGPLFAATTDRSATISPSPAGADMPWETYQAEDMKTTGTVLGPKYDPFLVEAESSSQKCVKLASAGEYVEFTVKSPANAMVVRYSLPDALDGGGIGANLSLYQNGKFIQNIPITSKYSWLYGAYPFTNDPKAGKPRNFYDDFRLKGLRFAKGDVIRLQKPDDDAAYCIVDLVDLEQVAPVLPKPANSLSPTDFGAGGKGETDDTEALKKCIAEAAKQGRTVWVPAGDYKLTGEIVVPSNVTLQGAGMWHTTFVGDEGLYSQPGRRVKFIVKGRNSHLADFAIVGKLTYRNDTEPNDGIIGEHGGDFTVSRLWVEHTKVGMWFFGCTNVIIDGCRLRNTLADGINFCTHTMNSVAQNCTTRNTGDDCFAIWPAAFDHSYVQRSPAPGSNVFRYCTGQLPFLANGGAIYGGANNRIENCLFTDISAGCGILISSTFPTADDSYKIDYNFSGTTVVRNCELVRCGGFDHTWAWRAAFQVCMDRRSISGVNISDVTIRDSISDGFSIVAPGSKKGQGTLTNARLDNVNIPNYGRGASARHGLWVREDANGSITIAHSKIVDIQNSSNAFTIKS